MPKFNKEASIEHDIESHQDLTLNKEGGIAFKPSSKTDLTLRTLTWMVNEPKYYEAGTEHEDGTKTTENQDIQALIATVAKGDPEYILKLAVYTRKGMYLRSAPIFLLIEAASHNECKPFIKQYTPYIISRADELGEAVALFITRNGQIGTGGKASMPNSLKEGLATAFHNFNEYQFAKYDKEGKVKLRDVLRLVHPKPKNAEESELFKKIRDRTLATPSTWEVIISTKGSKKESWEEAFPHMGYMAVLRNLRNFLKVGLNIDPICDLLRNSQAVADSKQFPYRFLSAYKTLEKESEGDLIARQKLIGAVSEALDLSVQNVPHWKGVTFCSCDNSGSMQSNITAKSTVQRIEVGNIMGALAHRISDAGIASVFGTYFKIVNLNPADSVMSNAKKLIETDVESSTNAYLCLEYLIEKKIKVDRIMIFSDMQCYGSENRYEFDSINRNYGQSLGAQLRYYKRSVNPEVFMYSFDLAGYGTLQFPETEPHVCLLAGFSDRVFEFIKAYEEFGTGMVQKISEYQS
jgi:hypothetical protein